MNSGKTIRSRNILTDALLHFLRHDFQHERRNHQGIGIRFCICQIGANLISKFLIDAPHFDKTGEDKFR